MTSQSSQGNEECMDQNLLCSDSSSNNTKKVEEDPDDDDSVLILTVGSNEFITSFEGESDQVKEEAEEPEPVSLSKKENNTFRKKTLISFETENKDPLQRKSNLAIIFKHMDGKTLQSARLVCKTWNEEGKKQIFNTNFLRVPYGFHSRVGPKQEFDLLLVHNREYISQFRAIKSLFVGDPRDIEILLLLQISWDEIEHLKFDPSLNLQLQVEIKALKKLMKLCSALKFVDIPRELNSAFVEFCISMKKTDSLTVSHLYLNVDNLPSSEKMLQDFANTGVRSLNLTFINENMMISSKPIKNAEIIVDALEVILITSKDVLTRFCLVDPFCDLLPRLNMPPMPQLRTLEVKSVHPIDLDFKFHPEFKFSLILPNLFEIIFNFGSKSDQGFSWNKGFDSTGEAPTVRVLTLQSVVPAPKKLFKTFSQIVELTLTRESYANLPLVWKFCKHLKKLKLFIYLYEKKLYSHLLSSLSGYSLETTDYLLQCNTITLMNADVKRANESILSIPGLEKLTFVCSMEFELKYMPFLQTFVFPFMPGQFRVELVKYP